VNRIPVPLPVRVLNPDFGFIAPAVLVGANIVSSSGLNEVVASPGSNRRLRIYRIEAHNNHASNAIEVGIFSSNTAARYLPALGGSTVWDFGGGVVILDNATAFPVYLSGAGTISVAVYYEIV
jgi:hypothetical protein